MNTETYLDIMAAFIVVVGLLGAVSNFIVAKRRVGYRKYLRFLTVANCLYISCWYAVDLFVVGIHVASPIAYAIRPGILLTMSLFLANAIANFHTNPKPI